MLEGVQVETTESETNIFASSTCNLNINTFVHKKTVTNSALVGNTHHFDNDIDSASSEGVGYGVIVPFGFVHRMVEVLEHFLPVGVLAGH